MARVELRGVSRRFPGGLEAVSQVDLVIEDGERLAIVGPSGSGKTTLLRLLAGLDPLDAGEILIDGRRVDHLPPKDRGLAMVLQNQPPYPYLSVYENLAFGLRTRGIGRSDIRSRVNEVAERLGLSDRLNHRPATLSGGERQRVVLGRAMATRPGLVLLDEPLSNLDASWRSTIRTDLLDLHQKFGGTLLIVTHDQGEALALGNRVGVMNHGQLVQVETPQEVYDNPKNVFVAGFLGSPPMNLLSIQVQRVENSVRLLNLLPEGSWTLSTPMLWTDSQLQTQARAIWLGLRPEQIRVVDSDETTSEMPTVLGKVNRLEPLGHETLGRIQFGPHTITMRLPAHPGVKPGDHLPIQLDLTRAHWFDPENGQRLNLVREFTRTDPLIVK